MKARLGLVLGALACFGIARGLASRPGLAEIFIRPGAEISSLLSRLLSPLPFAVVEAVLVLWIGRRLFTLGRGFADVVRRRRRFRNAAASAALVTLRDAAILAIWFYVAWGFGYARPPLETRLGWPETPPDAATLDAIADLASSLVDESNERYVALHGGTDAGEPTARGDDGATDRSLEEAWLVAGRALGLPGNATGPRGRVKPLLASPLLRRLGLSGVYCPFTAEATVNAEVPAVSYPQVVAHEKSHQRGIHPEDEANFLGWFVAECSRDPLVRYSASVFAQRQLLFALLRADPDRARDLIARRHPGVQRDVNALRAYWTAAEGPAADAARRMNDAYLRTNRVEGGIESYGRSVQLMLRWAASHDGSLRLPADDSGAATRSD